MYLATYYQMPKKAEVGIKQSTIYLIKQFEGFSSKPYLDSVGIPTIGFGETKGVKMGQTTTPTRALITLDQSIDDHVKGMIQCIHVPISQGEFDAYTSFTYNVGVYAFCHSNIATRLNKGDYEGACKGLLDWDHAGGKVLPGLTRRRQEEYQKCSQG